MAACSPYFDICNRAKDPAQRRNRENVSMMPTISRRTALAGAASVLALPAFIGRAKAATTLKVSTSFPNDPS
jgi:hypothetical protein